VAKQSEKKMTLPDDRLRQVLENQGYRELVSAHLFATGVPLAPTIDDKQMLANHAREELHHFEVVSTRFEDLGGQRLFETVSPRTHDAPVPRSWLETAVAGYLFDRAVAVQLFAYKKLGDSRLDALVDEILEHEHEHQAAAETALLDECRSNPASVKAAGSHVAYWYKIAVDVLDDSGQGGVLEEYRASIQATLKACGLSMPGAPGAA
jgi:1,2-phenylacetyl-CoA epoxidase catalytic subunit